MSAVQRTKLGSHPDNPNPAESLAQAAEFSVSQSVCPDCGKKGGHRTEAHALLIRLTAKNVAEALDAHGVRCGSCGTMFAVFHVCYSMLSRTACEKLARATCQPGQGFRLVTASGLPPQSWLPLDLPAPEAPTGKVAGPVVIHSLDMPELEPAKNGCGHSQSVLAGPTYDSIRDLILATPCLIGAIRLETLCVVCGGSLGSREALIIGVPESLNEETVHRFAQALASVRVARLPDDVCRGLMQDLSAPQREEAKNRAVCSTFR